MKLNLGAGCLPLAGYGAVEWCTPDERLPLVAGVYVILCQANGKVYVGSSNQVRRRVAGHVSQADAGKHYNSHLQRSWRKYGRDVFLIGMLEVCPVADLLAREAFWIKQFDAANQKAGFNLIDTPNRPKFTAAVCAKMSRSRKGRKAWNKGIPCPEHVKALNRLRTGRVATMGTRLKLSLAMLGPSHPHRGKKLCPEFCAALARSAHTVPPKSGYKGVYLDARTQTYMARLYAKGKHHFLGRFPSADDAARAYNAAAIEHYEDGCYLNPVEGAPPQRNTVLGRPARPA